MSRQKCRQTEWDDVSSWLSRSYFGEPPMRDVERMWALATA